MYSTKNLVKMLFTELVIALNSESNSRIYSDEIKRRLSFCGFEDNMIKNLIEYEEAILESTNKNYDNLLINKKWWLESDSKILEKPIEYYALYYNGEITKYAFTNSELVSIYDEADFLINYGIDAYPKLKSEILAFHDNDSITNLKSEFIHRIAYIYKRELKKEYNDEIYSKAMKFFINESHILFLNKYKYVEDENLKWKPYTNEYYKFFSH